MVRALEPEYQGNWVAVMHGHQRLLAAIMTWCSGNDPVPCIPAHLTCGVMCIAVESAYVLADLAKWLEVLQCAGANIEQFLL